MKLTIYNNDKIEYRGIYSINFDNGKRYIGLSERVKERLKEHCRDMRDKENILPVHAAMRKHNFEFELLEECKGNNRKELCEREIYWIDYYGTYKDKNKGYNLTPGGDGSALGCNNFSAKLNEQQIQEVYKKLMYNKDLYIYQIAAQYNISPEAMSEINNGKRYYNCYLQYPLRKAPKPNVGKGINNHLSKFKTQEQINEIYKDLRDSSLSLKEIAKKYNSNYTTISEINRGLKYITEGYDYPVRKRKKSRISKKIIQEIHNSLINTEETQKFISKKYGVSVDVVQRINNGTCESYKNLKYTYPIRANKEINKAVSTILGSEE